LPWQQVENDINSITILEVPLTAALLQSNSDKLFII